MGEPVPADSSSGAPGAPAAIDWAAARQFWSFQRPTRHRAPGTTRAEWIERPIDAFVLERMEAAGLAPSAPVDDRTWFRRVSFDLTGLPPTAGEMEAFLADRDDPALAREKAVDRLLDSPHFGERWARLWLDVARYAEDQAHIVGNKSELFYPNAWRYRDWVIGAFNDDLPYDEFIRLQLAADLIAPADEDDPSHVALGFMGLGPKYYRRGDLAVMADEWEDRVDTLSQGLLGLTVACARCHDHKFDPIPTSDYYALAGVFANTAMFNRPLDADREMDKDGEARKPDDGFHVIREAGGEVKDLPIHVRGDAGSPGPVTPRHFLTVLSDEPGQPVAFTSENSGRRDLAEAIASPRNPLTARVFVNRVWAACFGAPLVSTPSNFGALGEAPTHPELLDDLAVRFMEDGNWSLKWLVRELVLSATYGQDSRCDETEKVEADPDNRLLARMSRRRLPVEMWRDTLLAAAGTLDPSVGGPSMEASDPAASRRAVYSRVSRLQLDPLLEQFDFPDPNLHSAGRGETTTPLQKLFVLNHPLMVAQSDALAARLESIEGDNASRIERAYLDLYARPVTDDERRLGLAFLESAPASGSDGKTPWQQYAQVLLAANELIYLD